MDCQCTDDITICRWCGHLGKLELLDVTASTSESTTCALVCRICDRVEVVESRNVNGNVVSRVVAPSTETVRALHDQQHEEAPDSC
jgi:hypothetical protein